MTLRALRARPRAPRQSLPPVVALLTTRQYKFDKSLRYRYVTCGVSLAPANSAGFDTVCAMAKSCLRGCIAETNRYALPESRSARRRRTKMFFLFRDHFFAQLIAEVTLWKIAQEAQGLVPVMRPNTLSDLPIIAHRLAQAFPGMQFYDYSKLPPRSWVRLPNYHQTYSYSEATTPADLDFCIEHGINVAVIFKTKRGERLPKTVTLHGRTLPVIDGDTHDLRFLDPNDRTYAVGLRWKISKANQARLAAAVKAGLVIDPNAQPVQLAA